MTRVPFHFATDGTDLNMKLSYYLLFLSSNFYAVCCEKTSDAAVEFILTRQQFDKMVGRIESLENAVNRQNYIIQFQQNRMASMQATIRNQAEEIKTQNKRITLLEGYTRGLQLTINGQKK